MAVILGTLNTIMFLALVVVFALKYRQTRDPGFLWLAVSLVLFPLLGMFLGAPIAHWIKLNVDKLASGEPVGTFPFTLVESGRMTVGSLFAVFSSVQHLAWTAFVLVAVLMLCRPRRTELGA